MEQALKAGDFRSQEPVPAPKKERSAPKKEPQLFALFLKEPSIFEAGFQLPALLFSKKMSGAALSALSGAFS